MRNHTTNHFTHGITAVGVAGCVDGSARVWDVQTRQPLRTLANPAKGPVTAVLVMDRPSYLVPGTHNSNTMSISNQPTSMIQALLVAEARSRNVMAGVHGGSLLKAKGSITI